MLNRQKKGQFFNSCYVFLCKFLIDFCMEFQFLMVRLKSINFDKSISIPLFISIPSGSIIMIQRYKMFLDIPNFLDTILYVFLLIFINFFIDIYQFRL